MPWLRFKRPQTLVGTEATVQPALRPMDGEGQQAEKKAAGAAFTGAHQGIKNLEPLK